MKIDNQLPITNHASRITPHVSPWPSLESSAGLTSVQANWRRHMNGQFEIFKSAFLQKQPQLAKGYPCGHCACTHEVYIQTDLPSPNPIGRGTEGEGSVSTIDSQVVTIESLCRCDPPTCRHDHVTLTRADVELWSLNWTKLARALCHAFSLNYQFADLRPCNTRQIGSWSADAVPVILTIQSQRGFFYSVITELIARLHQKFILLAPTAKHFDAGCQELLANANAAFFPLDSNVILNPNGVLECVKEPSDLFSPISVPMLSPRSPDSVRRDSKFKVHGSTFDVRAAGPVPSPLATHNSLSASGGEGRGEVAPPPCNLQPSTRYCLRKGMGIWKLIFDGHETDLKHERGIFYVAWLLYHPPAQPIHALDLIAKIPELYRNQLGLAQITNPENGKSTILQSHARIQERNLALDDAQALRSILKKQQELEAILDDENESEPVKQEALRELESIVQFQKQHGKRSRGNAQRAADSVRKAITRFHQRLLRDSPRHQPSTINSHHSTTPSLHRSIPPSAAVLAKFAAHLEKHLLIPSRRYSGHGNAYARSGLAGCFTYEPPANSVWET